jgi:hypothetical protein
MWPQTGQPGRGNAPVGNPVRKPADTGRSVDTRRHHGRQDRGNEELGYRRRTLGRAILKASGRGNYRQVFIREWPGYFLTDLEIYADGSIFCLEWVDLLGMGRPGRLMAKLASGWIAGGDAWAAAALTLSPLLDNQDGPGQELDGDTLNHVSYLRICAGCAATRQ